jgi:hypothetical protein
MRQYAVCSMQHLVVISPSIQASVKNHAAARSPVMYGRLVHQYSNIFVVLETVDATNLDLRNLFQLFRWQKSFLEGFCHF